MRKQNHGHIRLYLHVFDWPTDRLIRVKGLKAQPGKTAILESGEPVETEQTNNGIVVKLPEYKPDEHISVVTMDVKETALA